MASTSACRRTRVEMVTMRPMPAASRARPRVELGGEVGKIEMAMAVDQHGHALAAHAARARRSAGTPADGGGSVGARRRAAPPRRARRSRAALAAPPAGRAACRRRRHERLRQDGDLPDHLGGDVEHRAHAAPDRSWPAPTAPRPRNSGWPRRPPPRRALSTWWSCWVFIASRALPIMPSAAARIAWSVA